MTEDQLYFKGLDILAKTDPKKFQKLVATRQIELGNCSADTEVYLKMVELGRKHQPEIKG